MIKSRLAVSREATNHPSQYFKRGFIKTHFFLKACEPIYYTGYKQRGWHVHVNFNSDDDRQQTEDYDYYCFAQVQIPCSQKEKDDAACVQITDSVTGATLSFTARKYWVQ